MSKRCFAKPNKIHIPTVGGTGFGTTTIQTGLRIRVESNRGKANIWDEA